MYKVSAFVLTATLLLIATMFSATVGASVPVGVKDGSWIEYTVEVRLAENAGPDALLSSDHNITWARMEITQIQGTQISLSIQTMYSNDTITLDNITLNLETGVLGDDFIIPANLTRDDTFFDVNQGNITILNVEQHTVAGAQRTVILGTTNETSYQWDQATGILVSAQTDLPNYTMTTYANRTNLWEPQATISPEITPITSPKIFEFDASAIFALALGAVAVSLIVISIIILRRRSIESGKP